MQKYFEGGRKMRLARPLPTQSCSKKFVAKLKNKLDAKTLAFQDFEVPIDETAKLPQD